MPSRKWRLEARDLATGTHYRLRTGRETRLEVNLRRVTREQAEAALARLQAVEDAGTADRFLSWLAESPDHAVAALTSDADLLAALEPRPVYSTMPLEEYVRTVYAPFRATDRPRTWKREEWVLGQIVKDLGRHRLGELDAHVVADYLDGLICSSGARKGKPMAGNTKRLRRAAVQAVLHRAYRLRHLPTEPNLSEFEIRDSTKPVRTKSEPLTLEEVGQLMDASVEPRHRAMWATGAGQGLRPSEIARLDWAGVDWAAQTLAIPPDETGEGKTELSAAVVPMTPFTFVELRKWWASCDRPRSGLIFASAWRCSCGCGTRHPTRPCSRCSSTSRRTPEPYADRGFTTALEACAKRAKLGRTINPYLLRDSFATIAWTLDIPLDTTRRMMRHVDEKMLQRVYQRPRPSDLAERLKAFGLSGLEVVPKTAG